MNKSILIGAAVLVAIGAGIVYLTNDSADEPAATAASAADKPSGAKPAVGAGPHNGMSQAGAAAAPGRTDAKAVPPDPRLAVLQVSPDNGLIKFVIGENGKVISEIDQDPSSIGFGKPTREYLYMGDKVVGLTAYRYMSDHVEVSRTMVAYKADGSVEEIRESTSYEGGDRQPRKTN
jgi:hypothetical protein